MAEFCPIYKRTVLYLDCLECDHKACRNPDAINIEDQINTTEKGEEKENEH